MKRKERNLEKELYNTIGITLHESGKGFRYQEEVFLSEKITNVVLKLLKDFEKEDKQK